MTALDLAVNSKNLLLFISLFFVILPHSFFNLLFFLFFNSDNMTALDLAVNSKKWEIAIFLYDNGAKLSHEMNKKKTTPFSLEEKIDLSPNLLFGISKNIINSKASKLFWEKISTDLDEMKGMKGFLIIYRMKGILIIYRMKDILIIYRMKDILIIYRMII
jgi:hypothetical protein